MSVLVDSSALRDAVRQRAAERADDALQAMLLDMERNAPRDSGAMVNDITIDEADTDTRIVRRVRAPREYSSYQDEGTGIYGPRGQRIEPVRAKALSFVTKDGTRVTVKSVAGTPRTGWFSDVMARWSDYLSATR